MIFALYSEVTENTILSNLGQPQYSYYFLLKSFRRVFESIGTVVIVENPEEEVDSLYDDCLAQGETCIFVSITPPYNALVNLRCPTVCLFAWEFSTIPYETWNKDLRHDWRYVFSRHGGTITLSSYTADTVHAAMGSDFPVLSVPSPIWDDYAELRKKDPLAHLATGSNIPVSGVLQDTSTIEFDLSNLLPRYFSSPKEMRVGVAADENGEALLSGADARWRDLLKISRRHWLAWKTKISSLKALDSSIAADAVSGDPGKQQLPIESEQKPLPLPVSGVVYTTVLNPQDGRKCHLEILTAFCWAFRDNPNATLIMKMTQKDADSYRFTLNHNFHQLYPYKCRVVVFNGFLGNEEYEELIEATTYYVNASHCEGLCLPLMEFLCAGKPAIAPDHTAMRDYINEDVAFVIETNREINVWPHDPRLRYRAERYRNNWESIVDHFQESFRIANQEPESYREMSRKAAASLGRYCSFEVVKEKMEDYFETSFATKAE